jgi:hypothetical protein
VTFGKALELMLRRSGYALVSEFVTEDRRPAVRVRVLSTSAVVSMYHSDAVELARGGATVEAILHRNRSVFPTAALVREGDAPARAR